MQKIRGFFGEVQSKHSHLRPYFSVVLDNKHKTTSWDVQKSKGEAWSDEGERLERCVHVIPIMLAKECLVCEFHTQTYP
jgi:hypothetical protein